MRLQRNCQSLKVPHMGWNQVHQQFDHPLWHNIAQHSRFYFVHSYYARPDDSSVTAATSDYPNPFSCALSQDNIFAVQFHPEACPGPMDTGWVFDEFLKKIHQSL